MFNFSKSIGQNAFCVLLLLYISNHALSQTNLVPNYSFESYTICPSGLLYDMCDTWYTPDLGGGAYFNVCSNRYNGVPNNRPMIYSYQYPRTGNAYLGALFWNGDAHNYFQVQLLDSLNPNHRYYAEYFVNLTNDSRIACNNQSMLFTKNAVYVDTISRPHIMILPANPQITNYSNPIITDTLNWIKVSGIFIAKGGEQFLTLGNFSKDNFTRSIVYQAIGYYGAGYYIDDVSVYDLDSFHLKADAGRDTTIKKGDSVFIGSYTNGIDTIKWLQNGTTVVDTTRPGFWIWPTTNTYYVLSQTVGGFTSSDTVYIGVSTLPVKFISYTATLKENKVENVLQTANEINVNSYIIEKSTDGKAFYRIGKLAAENKARNSYAFTDENVSEGVSYYRVLGLDNDGKRTYSGVQRVEKVTLNKEFVVYPNPANSTLYFSDKNIKAVQILDLSNKIEVSINNSKLIGSINVATLSNGVHFIRMQRADGTIKISKLFIQH